MCLALTLAFLTFTDLVTVYHIIVMAFLLGTVFSLDMPTRQSFVIEMVGTEDLQNAVALNSSIFNGARVLGPAVAGLVIAGTGEAVCFLINGLSFVPVIVGLTLMRLPATPRRERRPLHHELTDGFRFVRSSRRVRTILQAAAIVSVFGMSYQILLPVFADEVLGQGPRAYGMLMGALGLGAVLGALRLAGRRGTDGSGKRIVLGMAVFGASLFCFSFSRIYPLSWFLLLVAGSALITQLATTNALLQHASPDEIRGRVLSMYTFTLVGLAPIGTFVAGVIAQRISAPWAMRVAGIVCVTGAVWVFSRLRSMST
jgi:MFS family permease